MQGFKYRLLFLFLKIFFLCLLAFSAKASSSLYISHPESKAKTLSAKTQHHLDASVIKLGLIAYNNAVRRGITRRKLLTIVDFSKPSTERRFYTFDLENNKILYHELVAHGKYSGGNHAVSFSNACHSHKTSLGVYVTEATYVGKQGFSLRLRGLEKGYNDNVKARGVVVHGSYYVNDEFIKVTGQLARSQGCLALDHKRSKPIINTIKDGTLIMVYHPASDWAANSHMLRVA